MTRPRYLVHCMVHLVAFAGLIYAVDHLPWPGFGGNIPERLSGFLLIAGVLLVLWAAFFVPAGWLSHKRLVRRQRPRWLSALPAMLGFGSYLLILLVLAGYLFPVVQTVIQGPAKIPLAALLVVTSLSSAISLLWLYVDCLRADRLVTGADVFD